MYKRIIIVVSGIIGLSFGLSIGKWIWHNLNIANEFVDNIYVNGLIFAVVFIGLGALFTPLIERAIRKLQELINRQTPTTLIFGTIGIVLGVALGYIVSLPFNFLNVPFISSTLPLVFSIVLAIVGYQTAVSRKDEWRNFFTKHQQEKVSAPKGEVLERKAGDNFYKYKLLDTSVIIDGRIADIVAARFIEGVLVIPNFVLQELQYIADSSDTIKRAKGRRGLDILNTLQKDSDVPIEFYEGDFDDVPEVDSKLIRLAKLMDAAVLTNDYNLNKVCEFQNIKVFNINELANAVKPVVIPGETLQVLVIKAGTERKQGVAYLEDGTMIVVEDGQYYMNEWISVVVTSALQTAAGRMIFAKPTHSQNKIENTEE
ncbi:PIN/TRAM domain-containing protein [Aerococcaceae bacterium NML160702]|nr:PIN/TRAM domain-containing protein [Aerococcaceae bacterium NML160702]